MHNIITGGFPGPVSRGQPAPVSELDGVPCVPSAAELPGLVDLAVIAVPAPAVLGIAEDCGRRGVKALAVTASGLDRKARAELLGICGTDMLLWWESDPATKLALFTCRVATP